MVTLKVAQKWKRILEGRKNANASQDDNPIAAKEPLSHRSNKSTPRNSSKPVNLNTVSRGGSPQEATSGSKRKGFSTNKLNSTELQMPSIKEEEEDKGARTRNVEGLSIIPSLGNGGVSSDPLSRTDFGDSGAKRGPSSGNDYDLERATEKKE